MILYSTYRNELEIEDRIFLCPISKLANL